MSVTKFAFLLLAYGTTIATTFTATTLFQAKDREQKVEWQPQSIEIQKTLFHNTIVDDVKLEGFSPIRSFFGFQEVKQLDHRERDTVYEMISICLFQM